MTQGLSQVLSGVQHVGGDNQIIAVGIKALGDRVLFDVRGRYSIPRCRIAHRLRKETGRYIR